MSPRRTDAAPGRLLALASVAALLHGATAWGAQATGPLRTLAQNPRYFTDGGGRAVYLAGSHTWASLQDMGTEDPPAPFDYDAYLDFVTRHRYNYVRLWTCVLPHGKWLNCSPFPWRRTGAGIASDGKPRFDLTQFDPAYFERLRSRVIAAGERGIYVSVMLFEGYGVEFHRQPSDGYPFDAGNNINGVSAPGTTSQDFSRPQVTAFQDAYVRKVIDTVNDLDNVLYEIANEAGAYSTRWQYHMISLVKGYEATRTKQHPVGMTAQYSGGSDRVLFASDADWISPLDALPPEASGKKVVINDTDHSYIYQQMKAGGPPAQIAWAWENFARGNNIAFMDPYLVVWPGRNAPNGNQLDPYWDVLRDALMDVRSYAVKVDLSAMTPHGDLIVGGGFCLARPGAQYLVFTPAAGRRRDRAVAWVFGRHFTLATVPGSYTYEWFDPQAHAVTARGAVTIGDTATFSVPISGASVLWLRR